MLVETRANCNVNKIKTSALCENKSVTSKLATVMEAVNNLYYIFPMHSKKKSHTHNRMQKIRNVKNGHSLDESVGNEEIRRSRSNMIYT